MHLVKLAHRAAIWISSVNAIWPGPNTTCLQVRLKPVHACISVSFLTYTHQLRLDTLDPIARARVLMRHMQLHFNHTRAISLEKGWRARLGRVHKIHICRWLSSCIHYYSNLIRDASVRSSKQGVCTVRAIEHRSQVYSCV